MLVIVRWSEIAEPNGLNFLCVPCEPQHLRRLSALALGPFVSIFLTEEEIGVSSPSTVATETPILLGFFVLGIPNDNALDAHRTRFARSVQLSSFSGATSPFGYFSLGQSPGLTTAL